MDWLGIKEFFKDTFKYLFIIVFVLFLVIYIITLQQVVGPSMSPTLNSGDVVFLDKISYRFIDIKRNDIVALYYADSKYLIKRIVGMPGDKIEFKDNQLYVNDEIVSEDYLADDTITNDFKLSDIGYTTIPEDMYLVLGDNREDSLDSRDEKVGLIPKKNILGKVRIKIWPLNEIKIVK